MRSPGEVRTLQAILGVSRPDSGSKCRGFIVEQGSPRTGRGLYTGKQGNIGNPKSKPGDRQIAKAQSGQNYIEQGSDRLFKKRQRN